jgi:DNA-directed RNA polymerase subunit M/transcription elongation factor TFIIS
MTTIDITIYNKYKNELYDFFEDETLERIMEGINNFVTNYIETNDCLYLVNDIYINKVNEIIEAMNYSDYLGNMITLGHVVPEELAFLKPHELCPDKYKNIIEKKAYEHKQKKKGSNIFSCKKCKQSNCEIEQKQTRSADEPATTFVKCLECGFTFRF